MRARLLAILLVAIALWPRFALAIDCTKASLDDEKATCTDPRLKAADERLNETYRRVWRSRDEADRRGLKALQEDWIFWRGQSALFDGKIDGQSLREDIDQRRDFLEHVEGIGAERRGRLTFLALDSPPFRRGDSSVHVSAFKFAVPRTAGERLFNDEMDKKIDYGGSPEIPDNRNAIAAMRPAFFALI
ncbi:MAG: DUF1311 domain-containing protein [Hyphomicrobiales bacterium]|nr:DUF1311 domain-containing protein [Hyphomicrobiales bacterium]